MTGSMYTDRRSVCWFYFTGIEQNENLSPCPVLMVNEFFLLCGMILRVAFWMDSWPTKLVWQRETGLYKPRGVGKLAVEYKCDVFSLEERTFSIVSCRAQYLF